MILTFSAVNLVFIAIASYLFGGILTLWFAFSRKRSKRIADYAAAFLAGGIMWSFATIALYLYEGTWFLPK